MYTGPEFVGILEPLGVSHVVWVPDSTIGTWESALEDSKVHLVRVCREGEAWTLAAGLLVGGAAPVVVMQTTGFYESCDAMRNVLFDLELPVFAVVGVRNWLNPSSPDSARRFAEPVVAAWDGNPVWIRDESDKPRLGEHYVVCQRERRPGLVLMAEGRG